jgi:MYXO-CTERM domain-containing protein
MKKFAVAFFSVTITLVLFSVGVLDASTINNFNGGFGTAVTLQRFGDPGGPSIETTGGNPGGVLQLTQAINGQNNFATFDRTDAGAQAASVFNFDFRIAPGTTPSADGISFSYANTANYGTTGGVGSAPFTPEDPSAVGILGFGFDTWANGAPYDDPAQGQQSNYQEISVFYNGSLIQRINDTRLLTPPLTLDDGNWHTVFGYVDFIGATVDLNVDGKPVITDLSVPGLAPFESRVMFAARTGGENEIALVDNLNVGYVIPEPAAGVLALLGFGLLLLLRRRSVNR